MRVLLYSVLIIWLGSSLVCTGLNKNIWPFPSLNVFSELPKDKSGLWVVRIATDSKTYELDPGNILPMDFFVARAFVGDVARYQDEKKLQALLDYTYDHLKESRTGFDEQWGKPKIFPGQKTNIQIVLKVSKTERTHKYETVPLGEYVIGEKTYAQ